MRKLFLTLGVLIGNDALAQSCIPVPDCAAMGYTETSCEGDFLRCPFDTTKMACVVKKTTGASTGCEVGMIYYSDGTCSSLYNATKSIAGIVVEKDKLILSKPVTMPWASTRTDVSGITNITSSDTAKNDMNGKSNTAAIVSAYSSDTASNNAAKYCNSYTGGISGTEGEWYLPAAGELYTYLYGYFSTLSPVAVDIMEWVNFGGEYFWSSSEGSDRSAWVVDSSGGGVTDSNMTHAPCSVSCLLEI